MSDKMSKNPIALVVYTTENRDLYVEQIFDQVTLDLIVNEEQDSDNRAHDDFCLMKDQKKIIVKPNLEWDDHT